MTRHLPNLGDGDEKRHSDRHFTTKGVTLPEIILGKELVDLYMGTDDGDFPEFEPFQERIKATDGQALLDDIIDRLSRENMWTQNGATSSLISPLARMLFKDGEDRLFFDYGQLQRADNVLSGMEGSEDDQARVHLILPSGEDYAASFVGCNARHARFIIVGKGDAIGEWSRHSSYHMSEAPNFLGASSFFCDFYIEGVTGYAFANRTAHKRRDKPSITLFTANGEQNLKPGEYFFRNNNHLYIPDEMGGWHEITPEETDR